MTDWWIEESCLGRDTIHQEHSLHGYTITCPWPDYLLYTNIIDKGLAEVVE